MTSVVRKWRALFSVYAQDWLAYKANGIIWILTDMTTAITMPLVWASAASHGSIAGYSAGDFTLYYLAMLALGSFITSHIMWELAFEIREGVFTTYLVRPFSFFQTIFIRNLSWRAIRFVMTAPFFGFLALAYWNYLSQAHPFLGWQFFAAVLLGHCVSISVVMAMAMVALFIQEAIAVFELYYLPQLFLSGYLFPIAIMPVWAQKLAHVLPFYFTTGVPVDLLVGRLSPSDATPFLLGQIAWIAGSTVIAKALWKAGLKRYSGVGM